MKPITALVNLIPMPYVKLSKYNNCYAKISDC